eukprot:12558595-Ditylum_brightwellii.AAC.1
MSQEGQPLIPREQELLSKTLTIGALRCQKTNQQTVHSSNVKDKPAHSSNIKHKVLHSSDVKQQQLMNCLP